MCPRKMQHRSQLPEAREGVGPNVHRCCSNKSPPTQTQLQRCASAVDLRSVTPPIYLPPGSLVQVSAVCVAQMFRMVPTDEVIEICNACVRAAATFFEGQILLHEFEFMSNHLHLLATVLAGKNGAAALPDFMGYLESMLTKNLNAHRGISGKGFEGYSFQIIDRDDSERIVDAILYIQNQAVAANLVERNSEWGHCSSRNLEYGVKSTVDKPRLGTWAGKRGLGDRAPAVRSGRAHYSGRSRTPDKFSVTLHRPPGLDHLDPGTLRGMLRRSLLRRELEAMARRAISGQQVLGWDRARRIHYNHIPPRGRELFGKRPTHAASTPERREAAREREEAFRGQYALALEAFLSGDQDVVFPHGTYLMPRRFRARVARGPD